VQAAGVAVALLGTITLVVITHRSPGERLPIEEGLLSAAVAYERAFALLGFGLALARHSGLGRWLSLLIMAGGIASGVVGEADFANSSFVARHLFVLNLPGPLVCVIAGVALAVPLALQSWILPIFSAAVGILIGLGIGLAAPANELMAFAAGAALGSLSITAIPALLFPPIRAGWGRILTRIVGSWLIAIGVMLGGMRLVTAKSTLGALPSAPPAAAPLPPTAVPEAVPPPEAPRLFKHGHENDLGQP
jgi:hypothetical protein